MARQSLPFHAQGQPFNHQSLAVSEPPRPTVKLRRGLSLCDIFPIALRLLPSEAKGASIQNAFELAEQEYCVGRLLHE